MLCDLVVCCFVWCLVWVLWFDWWGLWILFCVVLWLCVYVLGLVCCGFWLVVFDWLVCVICLGWNFQGFCGLWCLGGWLDLVLLYELFGLLFVVVYEVTLCGGVCLCLLVWWFGCGWLIVLLCHLLFICVCNFDWMFVCLIACSVAGCYVACLVVVVFWLCVLCCAFVALLAC